MQAPATLDSTLCLDPGEVHAIELRAERLLIDERAAAIQAEQLKLRPLGTLGILLAAGEKKLFDVPKKSINCKRKQISGSPLSFDVLYLLEHTIFDGRKHLRNCFGQLRKP